MSAAGSRTPRVDVTKLNVDIENFPKPWPPFNLNSAYGRRFVSGIATVNLDDFSRVVQRPPSEEELPVLIHSSLAAARRVSQGIYLGAGLGFAWPTFNAWRKPGPLRYPGLMFLFFSGPANPDSFRLLGRELRGASARMWHGIMIRQIYSINFSFIAFFGSLFVALPKMMVDKMEKPELQAYRDQVQIIAKATLKENMERRRGRPGSAAQHQNRGETESTPSSGRGQAWSRRQQGATTSTAADEDDASATGGRGMADVQYASFQDPPPSDDTASKAWDEFDSQSNGAASAPPAQTRRRTPARSTYAEATRGSPTSSSSSDSFASSEPESAPQATSGSAWDRIRRQVSDPDSFSKPQDTPRQEPDRYPARQQARGQGDDFSFSTSDREKQLAKEQAQRDFDAMLERERQGQNPEDHGKNW